MEVERYLKISGPMTNDQTIDLKEVLSDKDYSEYCESSEKVQEQIRLRVTFIFIQKRLKDIGEIVTN